MTDCEVCDDFLNQAIDWQESCPECGRLWRTCFSCGHNFLADDEADSCLSCELEGEE